MCSSVWATSTRTVALAISHHQTISKVKHSKMGSKLKKRRISGATHAAPSDMASQAPSGKTQHGAAAVVSEYEAKRLQRMRENQEKMIALGMGKLVPKRERVKRERTLEVEDDAASRNNPRRSMRISKIAEAASSSLRTAAASRVELMALPMDASRPLRSRRSKDHPPVAYQDLDLPIVDVTAAASPTAAWETTHAPRVKKQRLSSQLLEIDLNGFHARWLGNQIWPKGKQTIMQGVAGPQCTPLFSRMSGIQMWKNAILLFVNVQGESMYDNVFHQVSKSQEGGDGEAGGGDRESAVYFQWFAQQRHHLESPAIVRLLKAQKGQESLRLEDESYFTPMAAQVPSSTAPSGTQQQSTEPVLLFIRHVDGPYIYCGRLGYLGHRANSVPLEFRWQLLDIAALAWDKIKTLVDASSAPVDGATVVVEPQAVVGDLH